MKKTRSEINKEIKNSNISVLSEQDLTLKRKKTKTSTNNISKIDDNLSSQNETKENKLDIAFTKLFNHIKKLIEKYEVKPEVSDKEYEFTGDKFYKILGLSKFKVVTQLELYYKQKYEDYHKKGNSEDICSICQYTFYDNLKTKSIESVCEEDKKEVNHGVLLENCSDHYFHIECLDMLIGDKKYIKCPNCNKIYGIMTGDQPPGKMKVDRIKKFKCDGYNCDTIQMSFTFKDGQNYTGTHRVGYLPNNKEGREILGLFKVAFDRKLLFTIGTSVTTGATNTTIWNGIHFKTNTHGGPAYFGYPDTTYFNRVRQEFAAKAVTDENIKENLEDIADSLLKIGNIRGKK